MKKIAFLLLLACAAVTVNAQLYVGGGLSFWNNDDADVTTFLIAPEVGYNLNSQWAVGAELAFGKNSLKTTAYGISPYARYSYYESGMVRLFLDGTVGILSAKPDGGDSSTGFQVGVQPGIALKLNDRFSLVSKIGFLGYRDDYGFDESFNRQGFGLDFSSLDVSLGVYVSF